MNVELCLQRQQFVLRLENALRDVEPARIELTTELGDVFQVAGGLGFVGIAGELRCGTVQLLPFCLKVRDSDSKNLQKLSSFVRWD